MNSVPRRCSAVDGFRGGVSLGATGLWFLALALSPSVAWGVGVGRTPSVSNPAAAAGAADTTGPWSLLSQPVRVASPGQPTSGPHSATARFSLAQAAQWPLSFEPVSGAAAGDPQFSARGPGYSLAVGSAGAVIAVPSRPARGLADRRRGTDEAAAELGATPTTYRVLRVRFEGAREDAAAVTEEVLPGRIHHLVGRDPQGWTTGATAHARIRYPGIYPGVDVVYYGNQRELEYDLVVAPGANPDAVRLRFDGVQGVQTDAEGHLQLNSAAGAWRQRRPVAYQDGPSGREAVDVAYVTHADGSVGFAVGAYDARRRLVIDPVLAYATHVGGLGEDQCWDVAVDAAGAAYVVGETESLTLAGTHLLSTNAFQSTFQGGIAGAAGDAFVAKLAPDGNAFEWFTYLGGVDFDAAFTIALAAGNEPVVAGFTTSTNFPVTANAFQSEVRGLTNRFTLRRPLDGFVARLKADGSGLVASTLIGGDEADQVLALGLLNDTDVFLGGTTTSTNFPVTASAWQSTNAGAGDGFVAVLRLAASGSSLVFGSYLGGTSQDSIEGVAVEPGVAAHVIGITLSTNLLTKNAYQPTNAGFSDAFVARAALDGDASAPALTFSTYLGGETTDYGYRIGVAPGGTAWAVGETVSTTFPVAAALQSRNAGFSDGFITRFAADGQSLLSSTYFGGSSSDALWAVAGDGAGGVAVVGLSSSVDFPGLTTNALQFANAGLSDVLVARIEADGTNVTSTLYGGSGDDRGFGVALDAAGSLYVAGKVRSADFPVSSTNVAQATFGGGLSDGFVLKLANPPALAATLRAEQVDVSWAAPNPGFVLESRSVAAPQGPWARTAAAVTQEAGRHHVALPLSATNEVFRLRWSP